MIKRCITLALALVILDAECDGLVCNPSRPPENGSASRSISDVEICARHSICSERVSVGSSYRIYNVYLVGEGIQVGTYRNEDRK